MKTRLGLLLLGTLMVALLSFKISNSYEVNNSTAEAMKIQGLYIFFCSKPVSETDYLGTFKVKVSGDNSSLSRLNAAIKRCKKEYPQAEGIVFNTIDFERGDAITFKK